MWKKIACVAIHLPFLAVPIHSFLLVSGIRSCPWHACQVGTVIGWLFSQCLLIFIPAHLVARTNFGWKVLWVAVVPSLHWNFYLVTGGGHFPYPLSGKNQPGSPPETPQSLPCPRSPTSTRDVPHQFPFSLLALSCPPTKVWCPSLFPSSLPLLLSSLSPSTSNECKVS